MELKLTDWGTVTPEKVAFIEQQANRRYDFALASREMLAKESVTTAQWLFGIIVGGTGYIVTLLTPRPPNAPTQWWIILPLFFGVLVAAHAAYRLFRTALLATPVKPPGNEPKNLAVDEQLAVEAHFMRLQEIAQLQLPIEAAVARNRAVAAAINEARWTVICVPVGVAALLLSLRLILP